MSLLPHIEAAFRAARHEAERDWPGDDRPTRQEAARDEAEEVCRVALNGDEWEVVGEWTTTAEVPATTVDAVAGPSDGRAGLLPPATSGGITCMTCGAALVPGGPVCCPRPRRTT